MDFEKDDFKKKADVCLRFCLNECRKECYMSKLDG